jgi:hypothetical protein
MGIFERIDDGDPSARPRRAPTHAFEVNELAGVHKSTTIRQSLIDSPLSAHKRHEADIP